MSCVPPPTPTPTSFPLPQQFDLSPLLPLIVHHLLLRHLHVIQPAPHSVVPVEGLQLLGTLEQTFRCHQISLQKAGRKAFQFLCSRALWWYLCLRSWGVSDLGAVPGPLSGPPPAGCLLAEFEMTTETFSGLISAQSRPPECFRRPHSETSSRKSFSLPSSGWASPPLQSSEVLGWDLFPTPCWSWFQREGQPCLVEKQARAPQCHRPENI